MKFYDRENERQVLGEVLQQSRRESRMTVLMGRRRIGKTELSQRCGDDTVLYFFVGKKVETQPPSPKYSGLYSSCLRAVRSHLLSTNSRTS